MCAVCERDNVWCECSPPLLSWDVRWHCWPSRSRPSSAPLPLFPPSGLMVIEGLTAAPALLQGACSYSAASTLILRTTTKQLRSGWKSREGVLEFKMCYISDWPKRFLKPVLLQLSRHQVGLMQGQLTSRPHWTGPQQRATVCIMQMVSALCTWSDTTRVFPAGGIAYWKWSREGLPVRCPPHLPPVSSHPYSLVIVRSSDAEFSFFSSVLFALCMNVSTILMSFVNHNAAGFVSFPFI